MKVVSAWALGGILFASVVTMWVPARWPVSLIEVGAYLLASAWLLLRGPKRGSAMLAALGFMAAWGATQVAVGHVAAASETIRAVLGWLALLALAFAAIQTFDAVQIRERFLKWFLITGILLCVVSTIQTFATPHAVFGLFPIPDDLVFVMGPFLNHGHYAAFVELLLPFALIPALGHSPDRWWYGVASGALVASVVASASRGGFGVIVVEVLAIAVLQRAPSRRLLLVLGGISVVAAVLIGIVGWESLTSRFLKASDVDRREMLLSSVAMFRDHPWMGVGLGSWPSAYPLYARRDDGLFANAAHNDWAQWADEGGLPALGAMLFLFGWTLWRIPRQHWLVGPVCVFAHSGFDYQFQKPQIAAMVVTLIAIAAAEAPRVRATYVVE